MFDLDQAIAEWRRQMAAAGITTPEVLEELENHLREDVERQRQSGTGAPEAFAAAVHHLGQPGALQGEFNKARANPREALMYLQELVARWLGLALPLPPETIFSASARQALALARIEAPRFHHDFIGTEHLLLGLFASNDRVVPKVLARLGLDRAQVRKEIEKIVGCGPDHAPVGAIPLTPRAQKALWLAAHEAKALRHRQVGPEHLFLGLLREGSGVAALVLKNLGLRTGATRAAILRELNSDQPGD